MPGVVSTAGTPVGSESPRKARVQWTTASGPQTGGALRSVLSPFFRSTCFAAFRLAKGAAAFLQDGLRPPRLCDAGPTAGTASRRRPPPSEAGRSGRRAVGRCNRRSVRDAGGLRAGKSVWRRHLRGRGCERAVQRANILRPRAKSGCFLLPLHFIGRLRSRPVCPTAHPNGAGRNRLS